MITRERALACGQMKRSTKGSLPRRGHAAVAPVPPITVSTPPTESVERSSEQCHWHPKGALFTYETPGAALLVSHWHEGVIILCVLVLQR